MEIKRMSLGPLGTNCYLIYNEEDAIVIDPGGDAEVIIDFFNDITCVPRAILLTHAHFDHIGAVDQIRDTYDIEVYLHGSEADWLADPQKNGSSLFTPKPISIRQAENKLRVGKMDIHSLSFDVLHTPGHSPGSVSFVFQESGIIFGGDVLFNRGVGRTDLPGGNMKQLMGSIRDKLYTLDEDMIVYPGHGPETTIGEEKKVNPFIKG